MQWPKIERGPSRPAALIDVEIGSRPGKQLLDKGDLGEVLVEMGLHVGVGIFARQRAGRLELRLGRGDREARRDRVIEPAAPAPALRSAPCSRHSRAAAVSVSAAGALRSIITLPAIMRAPRRSASAKKASTDCGCTVQ